MHDAGIRYCTISDKMAEKVEALSDEEDGQVQAHQSTVAPKIDKKDVHLASLNLAQKILAIDAKYNSLRLTSYPRLSKCICRYIGHNVCLYSRARVLVYVYMVYKVICIK